MYFSLTKNVSYEYKVIETVSFIDEPQLLEFKNASSKAIPLKFHNYKHNRFHAVLNPINKEIMRITLEPKESFLNKYIFKTKSKEIPFIHLNSEVKTESDLHAKIYEHIEKKRDRKFTYAVIQFMSLPFAFISCGISAGLAFSPTFNAGTTNILWGLSLMTYMITRMKSHSLNSFIHGIEISARDGFIKMQNERYENKKEEQVRKENLKDWPPV